MTEEHEHEYCETCGDCIKCDPECYCTMKSSLRLDKRNMELADLLHDNRIMREALEFVAMPITTKREELTVDNLLATIAEDALRVKETLEELKVK